MKKYISILAVFLSSSIASFASVADVIEGVAKSVTFSLVSVDGTTPFTYQWNKNSAPIAGATNSTYVISLPKTTDSGVYTLTVSNVAGSAVSDNATLTVVKVYIPVLGATKITVQ